MEGSSYSGSKRKEVAQVVQEVDDSDSSDSSSTSNYRPKRCKVVSSRSKFLRSVSGRTRTHKKNGDLMSSGFFTGAIIFIYSFLKLNQDFLLLIFMVEDLKFTY